MGAIRQIGDFGEFDALFQYKLVPGDGGAVDNIARGSIHAKAGECLR